MTANVAQLYHQRFRAPVCASHALYGNALERVWHQRSIQALADTTAQPLVVIIPVYEQVLAELRPAARLKEYLPIFVSRRVRVLLAQASSSSSGWWSEASLTASTSMARSLGSKSSLTKK